MNEDHTSLSDSQTEPPIEPEDKGSWWIASILSLVGFTGLGLLIAFSQPQHESDWTGARALLPIIGGLLLGAILCVIFALLSVVKGEKQSAWALILAVPCLLGLLWSGAAFASDMNKRDQATRSRNLTENRRSAIRKDPGIVLRERWDQSDQDHIFCYQNSFSDPAVHYSVQQLQQIYDEAPSMRGAVFQHPACPAGFLAAHFQEAWDLALKREETMLANIAGNPNTPRKLVEQTALFPKRDSYAVNTAKRALRDRAGKP